MIRVSIIGGSGYVGGELLRLLLFHPQVELAQVTSERLAGKPLSSTHPNLRGLRAARELLYCASAQITECDMLFVALPHGEAARRIETLAALAPKIIDCSADFRLRDAQIY